MRSDTIVAYMFRADLYCPKHISEALAQSGFAVAPGELHHAEAAETMLDDLARIHRIDREREETFDSGEFPKVCFRDQVRSGDDYPLADEFNDGVETADRCGIGGEVLAP